MKPQGLLHKSLPYGGNPTCGKILSYATEQVECMIKQVGKGLCVFKIGVTTNPLLRYPSYLDLGYTTMWLIHVSGSLGLTLMWKHPWLLSFRMNRVQEPKKVWWWRGFDKYVKAQETPIFCLRCWRAGWSAPMGWLAVSFFWFMRFHEFTVSNSQGLCGWACGKKCDSLKVLTPWVLQPVFFLQPIPVI